MEKAKSYKPDGKNDCCFLDESTNDKPCWGEVGPDEDFEDELRYVCRAHYYRFCNKYFQNYVKENRG